jgi:hypothetical protein
MLRLLPRRCTPSREGPHVRVCVCVMAGTRMMSFRWLQPLNAQHFTSGPEAISPSGLLAERREGK